MTAEFDIPQYLEAALAIAGDMKGPTVAEFDLALDRLKKNLTQLHTLKGACRAIERAGDQDQPWSACVDFRYPRRGALQRLLILFAMLGQNGIEPFNSFGFTRQTIPLQLASHVPSDVRPLIQLGSSITYSSVEEEMPQQLNACNSAELARLHEAGQRLSSDPSFASALKVWLRKESASTEAEIVQRTLGLLELLGYEW